MQLKKAFLQARRYHDHKNYSDALDKLSEIFADTAYPEANFDVKMKVLQLAQDCAEKLEKDNLAFAFMEQIETLEKDHKPFMF